MECKTRPPRWDTCTGILSKMCRKFHPTSLPRQSLSCLCFSRQVVSSWQWFWKHQRWKDPKKLLQWSLCVSPTVYLHKSQHDPGCQEQPPNALLFHQERSAELDGKTCKKCGAHDRLWSIEIYQPSTYYLWAGEAIKESCNQLPFLSRTPQLSSLMIGFEFSQYKNEIHPDHMKKCQQNKQNAQSKVTISKSYW